MPAGTTIVFFLTDAAGHFGGSSHVDQVDESGNSGCINVQPPMSTANSASGGPTAPGVAASPAASAPAATVTLGPGRVSAATYNRPRRCRSPCRAAHLWHTPRLLLPPVFPPNESASNRLSHPFSAGSRHHGRIPSIGCASPTRLILSTRHPTA